MKSFSFYYLFALLCLYGFPLSATADEQQRTTAFKTGVIVPLTGPLAEYGVAIKNGIELAQIENADKFSSCKFLFEDSEYKNALALTTFNKLISADKVALVYVLRRCSSCGNEALRSQDNS